MLGFNKLSTNEKRVVIIGIIVIVVALFLYFQGKKAGGRGKAKHIDLPSDLVVGGDPNSDPNAGGIPGSTIRRISTALHDDMDGWNLTGHNMDPYKEWLTLSDTGFVAVYNDFNDQFYNEGKGTLRKWIMDEMYRDSLVDDAILPRMAKLNLL